MSGTTVNHLGVEGEAALSHRVSAYVEEGLDVRRILGVLRHQPKLPAEVGLDDWEHDEVRLLGGLQPILPNRVALLGRLSGKLLCTLLTTPGVLQRTKSPDWMAGGALTGKSVLPPCQQNLRLSCMPPVLGHKSSI